MVPAAMKIDRKSRRSRMGRASLESEMRKKNNILSFPKE